MQRPWSGPWTHSLKRHIATSSELVSCLKRPELAEDYVELRPKRVPETSALLRDLADAKRPQDIGAGVSVIALKDSLLPLKGHGSQFLFFREFYGSLLERIRQFERVVLLGNPGVGKSVFAYYYLWRMIQNKDSLPPDHKGNTNRPQVVLFQSGEKDFSNMFLSSLTAEAVTEDSKRLLSLMDPSKSIYFFEPAECKREPYFGNLDIPTVAFCSPDPVRYKEFCKNGGEMLYMPCWSQDELLVVGRFLRDNDDNLSAENRALLADKEVLERFSQFGGIFRHVIPSRPSYVERCHISQTRAINDFSHSSQRDFFLYKSDLGPQELSHWICQYDVARSGEGAFRNPRLQFVNADVRSKIIKVVNQISLEERIKFLVRNDQVPTFKAKDCEEIYEGVIQDLLISSDGLFVEEIPYPRNARSRRKKEQKFAFTKRHSGHVHLKDMKKSTLYCPVKTNESVVDFLLKHKGKVYGLQVTRSKSREVKKSTLSKFFKVFGLNCQNFVYVLIPRPCDADICQLDIKGASTLKKVIWKVPSTYTKHPEWTA